MNVALAATYHDPKGRLCEQVQRVLPTLDEIFSGLAIRASYTANEQALSLFTDAGALVKRESTEQLNEVPKLGAARREAITLALQLDTPFVLYCDGDRVLHWTERYPEELAQVVGCLSENDFTVLGRTERAFNSHPRVQRDTEAIVNYVFQVVSGHSWDVMAAARGLSRQAIEAIRNECFDEEISTDVSWPLFLRSVGGFSFGYIVTEGLEFETLARYSEEIIAVGGYGEWLKQRDSDLNRWIHRLNFARAHVEAMIPFARERRLTAIGADRAPRVHNGGATRFQVDLWQRLWPASARRLNSTVRMVAGQAEAIERKAGWRMLNAFGITGPQKD